MFRLFKKKKKNIQDYIEYVDKNINLHFQINVFVKLRSFNHNRCDLQVFRQEVLRDFNLEVNHKNGYLLLLSFREDRFENDKQLKKFKNSNLFSSSHFVDVFGETYLIPCENKEIVLNNIYFLLTNVYEHTDKTESYIEFEKLGKRSTR